MSNHSNNLKKYRSLNPFKRICITKFQNNVIQLLGRYIAKSILDVGCGEALILKSINNKFPGSEIHGMDISKRSLDFARELLPNAHFSLGNIYNIPAKDDAFEMVLALEVLEHLNDPSKALEELRRVSHKYCMISIPLEPWFRIGNILSGKNWPRFGNDAEHLNIWNKSEVIHLISGYFSIKECFISFPWVLTLGEASKAEFH